MRADHITTHGILADIHLPFEDRVAIRCACKAMRDIGIDYLHLLGDWGDLYHWARFDKNWREWPHDRLPMTPDAEIEYTRAGLSWVLEDANPAKGAYAYKGNHEDRSTRGVVRGGVTCPVKSDEPQRLFKLKKLGYRYVEGFKQFGELVYTHGDIARKHTAAGMLDKWRCNVIYGHAHRREVFTFNPPSRKEQSAWGVGCLCTTDPKWCNKPNWHQGFAIVTHLPDKTFHVESVHIINGRTAIGGKVYDGNE